MPLRSAILRLRLRLRRALSSASSREETEQSPEDLQTDAQGETAQDFLSPIPEDGPVFDLSQLPLGGAGEEEMSDAGSVETHLPDRPDFETLQEGKSPDQLVPAFSAKSVSSCSGRSHRSHRSQIRSWFTRSGKSSRGGASIPSGSGKTADSDSQYPLSADGSQSSRSRYWRFAPLKLIRPRRANTDNQIVQGEPDELGRSRITGLAHDNDTDNIYMLMSTAAGLQVSILIPGKRDTKLSTLITNDDDVKYSIIIIVGEFIVIYYTGKLLVLKMMRLTRPCMDTDRKTSEMDTNDSIASIAGCIRSFYCLLKTGNIIEYSVPNLVDQVGEITPPGLEPYEQAERIATCSSTQQAGILSVNCQRLESHVRIYDVDWRLVSSVQVPTFSNPCLCLSFTELLLGGLASGALSAALYCIDVSRSAAAKIRVRSDVSALCYVNSSKVIIANRVCDFMELNLEEVRRQRTSFPSSSNSVFQVKEDLLNVKVDVRVLFSFRDAGRIRMNKSNGEALEMSQSGHVTMYCGLDVSRPLEMYSLPVPRGTQISGFDTTDEGLVVAIVGQKIVTFTQGPGARQLCSEDMGKSIRDVVCSEGKVFILLDEEVAIYNNENGEISTHCRLSLGIRNHEPRDTKLAVHLPDNVLYLVVPRKRVLKMNLKESEPSFTSFIDDSNVKPYCMAVSWGGELVIGGEWEIEKCKNDGLLVYSSEGELIKRVRIPPEYGWVGELALRPGGGAYITTSRGLEFFHSF